MKRNIIYIVTGLVVAAIMGIFFYLEEENSTQPSHEITDVGAEIGVPEDAVGFACDCGCQKEDSDGVCKCAGCDKHESKEKEPEIIYFENPEENKEAAFVYTKDLTVEPLTEDKVKSLVDVIKSCQVFGLRRCESTIIDNAVDDPQFHAISEAKYIYDASTNRVSNVAGEDITEVISFSVKSCENAYDFLKAYFTYRGIPYDFMTSDTSHKRDLLLNQRVYSFEGECEELERMRVDLENEVGAFSVDKMDCSFQIKTDDYGTDRVVYITLTVAGKDENGATVIKYVTYTLNYNGVLME